MAIVARTLAGIKSDPLLLIGGADRINTLFTQAEHVWRDRLLDPATILKLFILQVLHGNTAITHLRHLCQTAVCPSSYCDARARLPLLAMASVIETLCRDCIECTRSTAATWLGRRVLIADATNCSTPDTPAMQRLWPQPDAQHPGIGFPMIKLLALVDLATGLIVQLSMFCLNVHEMSQAAAMSSMLRPGDVLLGDRGFCSFAHLAMLALKKLDAVLRVHQKHLVDFTPNRAHQRRGKKRKRGMPTSRFVRRLGADDQLVEWVKPPKPPVWMTQQQYDDLPATMSLRELRYCITVPGRRTRVVTIVTTLLDPMRFPKRQIAQLYGQRWEIETNFRHLKQTMKMDQLKCKTPDGVMKELLVFTLVYNLVRTAMCAAAGNVVDPNRVSFIDAARWLMSVNAVKSAPGDGCLRTDLIINPPRPGRWNPRVLKRRIKPYDLMTKRRSQYMQPTANTEDMH
ncbi:MAG: IS4 family transposase [Planctomycetia bacterium]|nr:IS4 family transposase [Planctomycetia bacterium]